MLDIEEAGEVLVEFDVTAQRRTLAGEDVGWLRLGYAQHIHRAQGATATRTLVVTSGWQTSKEPAYVEASRARQGTDWHVSREDLGVEGRDTDRIKRLAQNMRRSDAWTPSLEYPELPDPDPDPDYGPGFMRTIARGRLRQGPTTRQAPVTVGSKGGRELHLPFGAQAWRLTAVDALLLEPVVHRRLADSEPLCQLRDPRTRPRDKGPRQSAAPRVSA